MRIHHRGDDSPKPEWPLSFSLANYLPQEVSYGWVDPATGQINDEEVTLTAGSGYIGTRYAKEGDVFRFHWEGGSADYTATADKHQCAILDDEGQIVPEPTS